MKKSFLSKIKTVPQLIQYLSECSSQELESVYTLLEIPGSEFEPYQHWVDDHYARNCIVRTDEYELILLCWEKNHYTPIHAHDNQECWVHNVKGEFEEIRFTYPEEGGVPEQIDKGKMNEQDQSYMNDDLGLHVLRNCSKGRAMTLHLYAKPIDNCIAFNEQTKKLESKTLKYHSLEGELLTLVEA